MVSKNTYVPILKLKAGELKALGYLRDRFRSPVVPLFDMPPNTAEDDEGNGVPPEAHVDGTAEKIMKEWRRSDPVFIDAWTLDEKSVGDPYPTALQDIAMDASNSAFSFIPVTGLRRSARYQSAAKFAAGLQGKGAALRVSARDEDNPEFEASIGRVLDTLEIAPDECDLIFDYGSLPDGQAATYAKAFVGTLPTLPYLQEWRSVVVASTSYPSNLRERVGDDNAKAFRREDWGLYRRVFERRENLPRLPAFADYAISTPSMDKFREGGRKNVTASIKYTTDDEYVVVRGHYSKEGPSSQYKGLARWLVDFDEFENGDFWADEYLRTFGAGSRSGSPTIMVAVGTARHVEKASSQIANLHDA